MPKAEEGTGAVVRSEEDGLWFAKTLADFEINDLAAPPAPVLL
jgi:hypothetical protein